MEGNGHNPQTPNTNIVLTITMDQLTGAVSVNWSGFNHALLVGMIEIGKQAIHEFVKEQAKGQRIVPAKVMPFIQH